MKMLDNEKQARKMITQSSTMKIIANINLFLFFKCANKHTLQIITENKCSYE